MNHHLISVSVGPFGSVHGYLMTNDGTDTEPTMNRVVDAAEKVAKAAGVNLLPIVCMTTLDGEHLDAVHTALRELVPDAWAVYQTATDFHCSIFCCTGPVDDILMGIH